MSEISGIHHLKIFVADLAASLSWWQDVTGAQRNRDLDHRTKDGELFACLAEIPGIALYLELRLDPAAAKVMTGLDPVTFAVETRADLVRMGDRLDDLGIEHSPVLRGIVGWILVVRTPDDLSVRFHTRETHDWDPAGANFSSPWIAPPRHPEKA